MAEDIEEFESESESITGSQQSERQGDGAEWWGVSGCGRAFGARL
jgi:hypothetical protein